MEWNHSTRYKILLEITNAIITKTTNQGFFNVLVEELKKHIPCDRISINLYDKEKQLLQYFTEADGVDPVNISRKDRRPLKGSIANMVIQAQKRVIIDDLNQYSELPIVGKLLKAGLTSTMAFPLIVREELLGTLHFSFKSRPDHQTELSDLLAEVSKQVAIAVDNLVAYSRLQKEKQHLEREKRFLIGVSDEYKIDNFYYLSPEMTEIMKLVKRVAKVDAPVFMTGETGTGKDFLARYMHCISPRKDHMFVKVNCPAIPSTLFESELFGHAKGAFTGADSHRVGRFEMSDKGTLFLDEIGDLPAGLQAKLLQVLQERRFERVGDSRQIEVDFRLIAATNREPEKSIEEGKLRKDLYYRLNIIRIHVPALRHRREDIPLLIERMNLSEAANINQPAPIFTENSFELLKNYRWPGNVRELKNFVKRMIILRPGEKIHRHDVEKILDMDPRPDTMDENGLPTLAESECHFIGKALVHCKGVIGGENGAARMLGVPRSTLQYRMKKYGIKPEKMVKLQD